MPETIQQAVAIRVPLQAYLASDHLTPATGKTIAITISKNGAAYGNPSAGATNATEIGSGSYYVDLSTTDTGTAGPLFVKGTEGTIDTIIAIYQVGTVPANVLQWLGTAAATPNVAGVPKVDTSYLSGTTDAISVLLAQAWVGAAAAGTLSTTQATTTVTGVGDDLFNHRWAIYWTTGPAAFQLAVITDYVSATGLFTFSPALTAAPNAADDFILIPIASGLAVGDRTGNLSGSVGSVTSYGTLVADVATAVWGAAARTLTAFDASFKTGYALSTAGVQAIWDALTSALTTVGSIGKLLVDNVNATISSRASQASVDDLPTNAELATALGTADDATLAAIAGLNNLSAAQVNAEVDTALADIHLDHLLAVTYDPTSKPGVADALLNELVESDAGVARYTANALEQAPTGGSAPSAADIADAVWDESTVGHTTAGTFGEQAKTDIDAILADTNELQTDWANGGRLDNILDARASQTSVDDLPTNAELAAAIAALNNLSQADVRTAVGLASANLDTQLDALPTAIENADAILKRDWTSVTGEATRSALNALRFLRNRWIIAGGVLSVKKEDDATDAWTGVVTETPGDPVSQIDPA